MNETTTRQQPIVGARMTRLSELRALAEKADPRRPEATDIEWRALTDALSPDTVLALLDGMEALRGALQDHYAAFREEQETTAGWRGCKHTDPDSLDFGWVVLARAALSRFEKGEATE